MVNFIYTAVLIIIISTAVYLIDKYTKLGKLSSKKRQTIYGILFGVVTVFANEFGSIPVNGVNVNIRDSSIAISGLMFGPWAGILAGIIGAVDRWFCVYWGGGEFTRVACSIACLSSGIFSAIVHKIMFNDRRPTIIYGAAVALICEAFHMLLIMFTHMNNLTEAFSVIDSVAPPMIITNVLTVALTFAAIGCVVHSKTMGRAFSNEISGSFLSGLLGIVVVAYFLITGFSLVTQQGTAVVMAKKQLLLNVDNVITDAIKYQTDDITEMESAINVAKNWVIGSSGGIFIVDETGTAQNSDDFKLDFDITKISKNKLYNLYLNDEKAYCMVRHSNAGYYAIAYMPVIEITYPSKCALYVFSYMTILVFASLFLLVFVLLKKVVINNMDDINYLLGRVAQGKLDTEFAVNDYKEFSELSSNISKTVNALKTYIDKEAERINDELEFAKKIQTSTLPNNFPAFPNVKSFDIFATMETAKEVGGDFYDFYFAGSNKFAIVIADVSGKGIPAAMFMMKAKTIIKSYAESSMPANEVLMRANEELCKNNDADMFVTVWLGIINLDTGVIEYANAGHNPPIILRSDGSVEFLKTRPGLVLAGMEGMPYKNFETKLEKGETIYLYTDGITEATNKEQKMFGDDRLLNSLTGRNASSPEIICKNVSNHVFMFEKGAEQFDDKTMLAFKYLG